MRPLLGLLLGFLACPLQPAAAQEADSLPARVARTLAEVGLVGVSWALVTPETTVVGAAGLRDVSRGTTLSPDDRVHVGSVAKTLVATGILSLVTDGRIGLDDRVDALLPALRIANPWADASPLRLRHLLDHTGGLDDARMHQVFTARGDPDAPLAASLGTPPRVRVRHRPGDRFSYSNTGYLLLGMIIEQVTGQRYERWLDAAVLAPLGMTRSTFGFVSQRGRNADPTLAMGHFDAGVPQDAYTIPVRPASQFTTTPADMARFARFLMGDGRVEGRTLVHDSLLRQMAVPTTTEAARAGLGAGYALGLMRRERWGVTGHCHLGNIGTFRAILCLYPDVQRAFFASYNADPENGPFDRVDSLFADALGVPETPALPLAAPSVDPAAWDGWYVIRPNRFAQFAYLDALGGVTRIAWSDGALRLQPMPGDARRLEPVGGNRFRLESRRDATHVLGVAADGAYLVTDGLRTYERVARGPTVLRWLGAALGLLGVAYLLVVGGLRCAVATRRGALRLEPLRWPTLCLWLMPAVSLLYLNESPLAIGDPTLPSIAMSLLTALLPLAVVASMHERLRSELRSRWRATDLMALVATLQWCVTLAAWGLLPLLLWR